MAAATAGILRTAEPAVSAESPPVALRRRPSRSVAATICAVVLLALGVAAVVAALLRLTSGTWPEAATAPLDWLAESAWNSPGVWAAGIALAAAGLVLLLAGIVPGRFHDLPVRLPAGDRSAEQATSGGPSAVMSRRAVAQLAAATCEHIDGVSSASATATDRDVRVTVTTALHDTQDLQRWVGDGVHSRLEASGLDPVPRVRVSIRSRE